MGLVLEDLFRSHHQALLDTSDVVVGCDDEVRLYKHPFVVTYIVV